MSSISIVAIFYNITRIDRREKIVNFSLQYKQAISTYVLYCILHVVVILVTVPTKSGDFGAHKIS